jgi:hypothetical protein
VKRLLVVLVLLAAYQGNDGKEIDRSMTKASYGVASVSGG